MQFKKRISLLLTCLLVAATCNPTLVEAANICTDGGGSHYIDREGTIYLLPGKQYTFRLSDDSDCVLHNFSVDNGASYVYTPGVSYPEENPYITITFPNTTTVCNATGSWEGSHRYKTVGSTSYLHTHDYTMNMSFVVRALTPEVQFADVTLSYSDFNSSNLIPVISEFTLIGSAVGSDDDIVLSSSEITNKYITEIRNPRGENMPITKSSFEEPGKYTITAKCTAELNGTTYEASGTYYINIMRQYLAVPEVDLYIPAGATEDNIKSFMDLWVRPRVKWYNQDIYVNAWNATSKWKRYNTTFSSAVNTKNTFFRYPSAPTDANFVDVNSPRCNYVNVYNTEVKPSLTTSNIIKKVNQEIPSAKDFIQSFELQHYYDNVLKKTESVKENSSYEITSVKNQSNQTVSLSNALANKGNYVVSVKATKDSYTTFEDAQLTVSALDTITALDYSPKETSVLYKSSVSDALNYLPRQVQLTGDSGQIYTAEFETPWVCDTTFTTDVPDTYTFHTTLKEGNFDWLVSRYITATIKVVKSDITDYTYTGRDEITVSYNTTLNNVVNQLRDTLTLNGTLGYTTTLSLDYWSCDTYDQTRPNDYVFTAQVTIPDHFKNAGETLTLHKKVKVQKPSFTNVSDLINNEITVPFNTSLNDVNELLKDNITVEGTDNYSTTLPLDFWECSTFDPTKPKQYTFSSHIILPEPLIEAGQRLTFTKTVKVDKPSLISVSDLTNTTITVEADTTLAQINRLLQEDITLTCTDNYTINVPLDSWECSAFNSTQSGIYTFITTVNIPEPLVEAGEPITFSKTVIVNLPKITTVKYNCTTTQAIYVEFSTPFENAKELLINNVDVELNTGITISLPVNTNNWVCNNYIPTQPGAYLAYNRITLPESITTEDNENSIVLYQPIIVKEPITFGVEQAGIPNLIVKWGTSLEEIFNLLVTDVTILLNNNTKYIESVNKHNWTSLDFQEGIAGQFKFTNNVTVVPPKSSSHISTDSQLQFEFSTPQAVTLDFYQNVVVLNRKITNIQPIGEFPIQALPENIKSVLPNKCVLTFEDGSTEIIDIFTPWSEPNLNYFAEQQINNHIVLPKYYEMLDGLQPVLTITIQIQPEQSEHEATENNTSSSITVSLKPIVEQPQVSQYANVSFAVANETWYKNDVLQESRLNVPPEITDNRLYIPLRYLAYALNVQESNVKWNNKTKEVTIKDAKGRVIMMYLNSTAVNVDGVISTIDGKPYLKEGRLMLPISQVCKVLLENETYSIKWSPKLQQVKLNFNDTTESDDVDFLDYTNEE